MKRLARVIRETHVKSEDLAIFYLAQAGFCFKNSKNKLVFLDPYLTDSCQRMFGFKRMIPPVISPEEVDADVLASTHSHLDHLDIDAIPVIAKGAKTHFIGSPDCEKVYQKLGIPGERFSIIKSGEHITVAGIEFRAIYADHGEQAPDAIGLLIDFGGIKVYNVGDSSYRPEKIKNSLNTEADIMISPINGHFGNMDEAQTCQLALVIKPDLLIASHFGMFIEHGGDPAKFLEEAKRLHAGINGVVMAPGEKMIYSKQNHD